MDSQPWEGGREGKELLHGCAAPQSTLRDGNWGHRAWESPRNPPSPLDMVGICSSQLWTRCVWLISLQFPGFQTHLGWILNSCLGQVLWRVGHSGWGGIWFGGQSKVKLQHPLRGKATPWIFPDLLAPEKSSFGISGVSQVWEVSGNLFSTPGWSEGSILHS